MRRLPATLVLLATVSACSSNSGSDQPDGPDGRILPPSQTSVVTESSMTPQPARNRHHVAGQAAAVLATIPVKGRAPMTGYDRDLFGFAWADDTDNPYGHNGCDTRNDVLRRDLYHPVIESGTSGCVVLS